MTRRLTALIIAVAVTTAGTGVLLIARERARTETSSAPAASPGLALIVFSSHEGSLPVVVGTTGSGSRGALVIPPATVLVVPGQGEATVEDALELPLRQAATAVANLLGVWIEHYATMEGDRLSEIVEENGGITIGGDAAKGSDVAEMLAEPGSGRGAALGIVLEAMFNAGIGWRASDLADADHPAAVAEALSAVLGSRVTVLRTDEVASGIFRATPEEVTDALVEAFGGPAEAAVPVIVLNGNGVPGIGERVAERLLPKGFRVAVSQNASDFNHLETLIVVGSPADVGLAERVRDLLGVGSVSVSVGSGIAPVTIVVGEDFTR